MGDKLKFSCLCVALAMQSQLGITSAFTPANTGSASSATISPGASPATAMNRESMPFEVSPTVGFMGGSALLGVRASMNYFPASFELSAEQVMGRTATLYPITFNAKLDLANTTRTVPYGIIGGGLFLTVPLNSIGDQTVSSVGLAFGGGIRYYITSKIGIRFETKQLFTRVDNKLDQNKELLIFQSTSLGVIFAFG